MEFRSRLNELLKHTKNSCYQALIVYATGIFGNAGNYKSFGDTKIIPTVPMEKLEALINTAKISHEELLQSWNEIKHKVYSLEERERQLGLGEEVRVLIVCTSTF